MIVPKRLKILAGLICGSAIAISAARDSAPEARHRPLHINCPPGSHGQPWQTQTGQRLHSARAARDGALVQMQERRLTAGHPSQFQPE
jgi:hypothetical protein